MRRINGLGLLLLLALPMAAAAQDVQRVPEPEAPLAARWSWADDAAPRQSAYWVGYSIERLMGEHSYSFYYRWDARNGQSLHTLLYGVPAPEESLRDAAERALADLNSRKGPERLVVRDMAILLYIDGRTGAVTDGCLINLAQEVDLKGVPLFWLGRADDAESLALVRRLYEEAGTMDGREVLLSAAGIHDDAPETIPFLASVLNGQDHDDLREKAAFWIGQQDGPEALRILQRAIAADPAQDVREHAVFALSQMELPAATDALIALARDTRSRDREVRKKAVFWLGQKASQKAVAALQDFIADESDTEVQKQAVFALTQLPDERGTPLLIDIAKTHRNPQVRKQAIFWLGQSDDPRALELLIQIVKGLG